MASSFPYKTVFITGAGGFIGSNLVDRCLAMGLTVCGYDNFSNGRWEYLKEALKNNAFSVIAGDILDAKRLREAMRGSELVIHLAANADVRHGLEHPEKDLEQNTVGTQRVLEAARLNQVKAFAFSSTGSVYGDAKVFPTPEDAPFPIQTSLYAASKLAGEALIQAYAEGFGIKSFIFRFVSILGERYSHGHVFDFVKNLRYDPDSLHILGNGKQRKSYLYVQDCCDAMLLAFEKAEGKLNIFNLGTDESCEVLDSVGWICEGMKLKPSFSFSGGERGWVGDSPFILLDCSRIRALGWRPKLSIREGVLKTLSYLEENSWILESSL